MIFSYCAFILQSLFQMGHSRLRCKVTSEAFILRFCECMSTAGQKLLKSSVYSSRQTNQTCLLFLRQLTSVGELSPNTETDSVRTVKRRFISFLHLYFHTGSVGLFWDFSSGISPSATMLQIRLCSELFSCRWISSWKGLPSSDWKGHHCSYVFLMISYHKFSR